MFNSRVYVIAKTFANVNMADKAIVRARQTTPGRQRDIKPTESFNFNKVCVFIEHIISVRRINK